MILTLNRRILQIGLAAGVGLFSSNFTGVAATAWSLVWADEFSQPDGSEPDPAKWSFEIGGNGWGNNELETYTSRTNNCRIEDGKLVIEARQESYTGSDGISRNYTSARLKTQGKATWTYGRIEARIKIPRGQGLWPSFWMLGANIDTIHWPGCGEIDIMENIGAEPSTVHGTVHGPGYSGSGGIGAARVLSGGAAFADDFHLFTVEWESNQIRWYVDGEDYFTLTPANLPVEAAWVFNQPQFLLLNVAVGGNWPGNPNGTASFPQRMTVDYVRVYAANDVPGCGANVLANPGFETGGLSGWTSYGAAFNTQIADSNNAPVHTGSSAFKVFGQFSGAENYSGIFQDKSCIPGDRFFGDGWILTSSADRLGGGNKAWLEVSFRDSALNMLALYRSDVIDSNSNADTWQHLVATNQFNPITFTSVGAVSELIAPPGANVVRYQTVFQQPASAGGSVFVDDLNLFFSAAGESAIPTSASTEAGELNLFFATLPGLAYEVRYTDDLADGGGWRVLTNLTGDGGTRSVTDRLRIGGRFYRVLRVCD